MANGNDKDRREQSETPAPVRKPDNLEKAFNHSRKINEHYSPRPVPQPDPPPDPPPEKKR